MPSKRIRNAAIALTLVGSIVSAAGVANAQQAATNETPPPALMNGMLTVPGAPTGVASVPSKFSTRPAGDDKLSIVEYTLKHLTDQQRRAIYQRLRDKGAPRSDAASFQSYDKIGAEIPTVVEFKALYPLPDEIVSGFPELRGLVFTKVGDKILLVNPRLHMVITTLDP